MKHTGISALLALGGVALLAPGASAQTDSFTADILGVIQSATHNTPSPFQLAPFQIGPAASNEGDPALNGAPGVFTSYTATPGLPQIRGNDLDKFGFSLYATSVTPVSSSVYDYTGTFRFFAPGYGYTADDGQILEHGTFNAEATFTAPYTASVTGLFNADPGFLQPPGYPVPVDFSPGSPAQFLGAINTGPTGVQTLSGRLQTVQTAAVPEAGTLPLVVLGGVALALVGLRRKRQGVES